MSFALRGLMVAGERRPSRFGRSTPDQDEWRTVPETWAYPEEEATSREMRPQYDTRFRDTLATPPKSPLVDVNPEAPPKITVPRVELGGIKGLGIVSTLVRPRTAGVAIAVGTASAGLFGLSAWAVFRNLGAEKSTFWTIFRVVGGVLLGIGTVEGLVLTGFGIAAAAGADSPVIREEA